MIHILLKEGSASDPGRFTGRPPTNNQATTTDQLRGSYLVPYCTVEDSPQHTEGLGDDISRLSFLDHVADPLVDVGRLDPTHTYVTKPRLDPKSPGSLVSDLRGRSE